MFIYFFFALLLTLSYVLLMSYYVSSWQALAPSKLDRQFELGTRVSVLVPARNEAQHIERCIQSILSQNYPSHLLEIIVIDDHSEDDTASLAAALGVKVLDLAKLLDPKEKIVAYKKKAIELAIEKASGELIVCTDADCYAGPHWLRLLVQCYEQEGAKFIAAPVQFVEEKSQFERFQSLDFLGMMLITGAGIQSASMRMCNGANLAYPKAVFKAMNGFSGLDHLASGDDMLLLQKIAKQYPQSIRFVKNPAALVSTAAMPTLAKFWQQRIRWASKSGAYKEPSTQFQLLLVWLFSVSILLSFLLTFLWGINMLLLALGQLIAKAVVDYRLLSQACKFFHRKELMAAFWPSLFMHWAYIVTVGLMGNLQKNYVWKGRKTR